jgi:hypothetical protein
VTGWEPGDERKGETRQVGLFTLSVRHREPTKKVWAIHVENKLVFTGTAKTREQAKDACEAKLDEILQKIVDDWVPEV